MRRLVFGLQRLKPCALLVSLSCCKPNTSVSAQSNYSHSSARLFATMSGSADEFVRGSIFSNGLAVITLDRPKALNAMNLGLFPFQHFMFVYLF
ncbi:3-hydroxyisobutyryl-CoA hydrolase-like protein 4, mitochondrial [Dendrobium catenatum]|uniref:3-hydroxyisobutyryl-CoA hydrolase-like protein 4, mitochondrial n=1 Tax=Dendrobium catenatum TaxID=906689 RepID=A0A2I0WCS0_9ASPA|nr:3-hydroxyisobutyryl-CoA hydrolase-like protein 4, mitochondrial [Dendrobium catenatum]